MSMFAVVQIAVILCVSQEIYGQVRRDDASVWTIDDPTQLLVLGGAEKCPTGDGVSCGEGLDKCYVDPHDVCDDPSVCDVEQLCADFPAELSPLCDGLEEIFKTAMCLAADIFDWVSKNKVMPKFGEESLERDMSMFATLWSMGMTFCDDGKMQCFGGSSRCMAYAEMSDDDDCGGLKGMLEEVKLLLASTFEYLEEEGVYPRRSVDKTRRSFIPMRNIFNPSSAIKSYVAK
ncbi:uncharacterized protein LOC144453473 isoform X2 [Glandiceps talaboti]